jgi:hypothetical protein
MRTVIIIKIIIAVLIVLIPILANIKTPKNLRDWYTDNAYKAAIGLGVAAMSVVWILYFVGIIK